MEIGQVFARLMPLGALLLVLVLSGCGELITFGVTRTPITFGVAGAPAAMVTPAAGSWRSDRAAR